MRLELQEAQAGQGAVVAVSENGWFVSPIKEHHNILLKHRHQREYYSKRKNYMQESIMTCCFASLPEGCVVHRKL